LEKIRVLFANYHCMVSDTLRSWIAGQEDIEVVADCRGPMRILQETGRTKADAVILAQRGSNEPGLCSQLLSVYPDLTVLCVGDNETLFVEQLREFREQFSMLDVRDVVSILRKVTRAKASIEVT